MKLIKNICHFNNLNTYWHKIHNSQSILSLSLVKQNKQIRDLRWQNRDLMNTNKCMMLTNVGLVVLLKYPPHRTCYQPLRYSPSWWEDWWWERRCLRLPRPVAHLTLTVCCMQKIMIGEIPPSNGPRLTKVYHHQLASVFQIHLQRLRICSRAWMMSLMTFSIKGWVHKFVQYTMSIIMCIYLSIRWTSHLLHFSLIDIDG